MQTTQLDLTADTIDVRDIIARVEELEAEIDATDLNAISNETIQERSALMQILSELSGNGGDEKWRGDWYPVTLISDSYFTDYARELLEDCGEIPANLPHYIEVDWEATARNIRMDYAPVDIDDTTYWYR